MTEQGATNIDPLVREKFVAHELGQILQKPLMGLSLGLNEVEEFGV